MPPPLESREMKETENSNNEPIEGVSCADCDVVLETDEWCLCFSCYKARQEEDKEGN